MCKTNSQSFVEETHYLKCTDGKYHGFGKPKSTRHEISQVSQATIATISAIDNRYIVKAVTHVLKPAVQS